MRIKWKLFLCIFIFIGLFGNIVFSNESKVSNNKVNNNLISFNVGSNNELQKYSNENSNENYNDKIKTFTNMGIAGAVLFGTSFLFTLSGSGMIIGYFFYGLSLAQAGGISALYSNVMTLGILLYGGIGILVIGQLLFYAGLPLMIVGFALAHHYKNKVSIISGNINNNLCYGISIKIGS